MTLNFLFYTRRVTSFDLCPAMCATHKQWVVYASMSIAPLHSSVTYWATVQTAWPIFSNPLDWKQQKATLISAKLSRITMPQMPQILKERAVGMHNAGMSIRAVGRQLNIHFSTISRLRHRFRQTGNTCNRPHNRRPRVTTPDQDRYIRLTHLRDRLRPATRTADETFGLHNRRISAQTVRNRLRENNLRARRPHRGLDIWTAHTAVCHWWQLECSTISWWNS